MFKKKDEFKIFTKECVKRLEGLKLALENQLERIMSQDASITLELSGKQIDGKQDGNKITLLWMLVLAAFKIMGNDNMLKNTFWAMLMLAMDLDNSGCIVTKEEDKKND